MFFSPYITCACQNNNGVDTPGHRWVNCPISSIRPPQWRARVRDAKSSAILLRQTGHHRADAVPFKVVLQHLDRSVMCWQRFVGRHRLDAAIQMRAATAESPLLAIFFTNIALRRE